MWDQEAADASTAEAKVEYERMMEGFTVEQRLAVEKVAQWMSRWYNGNRDQHATGWKALCYILTGKNGKRR